jgi:hypothetical protein
LAAFQKIQFGLNSDFQRKPKNPVICCFNNSLICSGVDVYTAIAGGVGALYGPLHGGANEVIKWFKSLMSIFCIAYLNTE